MLNAAFLPTLPLQDVERASHLILRAYGATGSVASSDELRLLQQELFEIQKLPEAWGLVIPLLNHHDENVQFFGAHTAQVKIARDWATFPQEHSESLRDLLVQLTSYSAGIGKSKLILRKLFVSLTSLALRLVPQHPTRWPEWILHCVTSFSGNGASAENVLDFLSISAEEVETADLTGSSKSRMLDSMKDAIPLVVQAIKTSLERPRDETFLREISAALKCFQSWLSFLPTGDFSFLIPVLIALLDPKTDVIFVAASDTLQEIMSKSPLSDGSGTKILTEPLLFWLQLAGANIVDSAVQSGYTDDVSYSLCKLLTAFGDHSAAYVASNIASTAPVTLLPSSIPVAIPPSELEKTKGQLSQNYLRLLLAYTGFPGFYGVDEDVSEMTLGFWYMLQEALWNNDYYFPDGEEAESPQQSEMGDQSGVAKSLYVELLQVLKRKITWPSTGHTWSKDQIEKFVVYRRDVGDILINAYYIIREDMIVYLVNDFMDRLRSRSGDSAQGWEDIEATLHCISSVQEAADYAKVPRLEFIFSPQTLSQLPTTGNVRLRRTVLGLIAAYASWFQVDEPHATVVSKTELLMSSISYIVQSLPDQMLSLQAATALQNLCDANKSALAPRIGAFAELHAGLAQIPDSEKCKVMESIANVIQAIPPLEAIPTIEVIISPILSRLFEVLQSQNVVPTEARDICIIQLGTLTGIAKGLTKTLSFVDGHFEDVEEDKEFQLIQAARQDPRMVQSRESILDAIRGCVKMFNDAETAQALNDLVKAITSLPSDVTLISLPAPPVLEIVCFALQRQPTASWFALAGILTNQLVPATPISIRGEDPERTERRARTMKDYEEQAGVVVGGALPVILNASLSVLGTPGGMENNPDIVQEFFQCLSKVAQGFIQNFYTLPPGGLDALMQCTIRALSLQERYSLVAACTFLNSFISRTAVHSVEAYRQHFISTYGRAIMQSILIGLAGQAPRSVTQNLIELLSGMLNRFVTESTIWLKQVLLDPSFPSSQATLEDKERFMKAVVGSKSMKKTREAAQQFTLVARGLEGTGFGYATMSM